MGAIAGLLGLGGGASGSGFQGPQLAPVAHGVNADQASTAYGQTQQGLSQQQALLAALQGQNGLGLQNQAAQGYSNLANGTGPNPALAQLAQTTGQNVAQQGALQAGQRGASQNVGLMARQIGQQGANTQQQGAGQAATLAAQQQLMGLQGLAGQANTIAGQQVGQTNANTGSQQSQYGNVLNALNGLNNSQISNQGNVNNNNAQLANTTMQGQQGLLGSLLNGASSLMGAEGGQVEVSPSNAPDQPTPTFGTDAGAAALSGQKSGGGGGGGGMGAMLALLANGGTPTNAPQSSLGKYLSGIKMAAGGSANDFRGGGKVEATESKERAVKSGDSYSNDKIPAVLSEHEIVLPRSVTMSADPISASAKFVAATLAKRRGKK